MIKAHGKTYPNVVSALEAVSALKKLNAELGASDGRVTEINAIEEALEAARIVYFDKRVAELKAETEARNVWRAQQIAAAKKELVALAYDGLKKHEAERRIEYIDARGNHRVTRYITEEGFLKALIRLHSSKGRTSVINAD